MINVSDEFYKAMQDRTDFVESAEIALANGTVLSVTKDDFTISNNSVVDGAGESSFPLGVAIARSIQLELMNDEGQFSLYDFFGAEIRLYLSFHLSASTEKIAYGKFTVSTPETRGTTVIITAVDDMHKADAAYTTNLTFPVTTGELLRDSCTTTGISLATANFTNSDFLVQEKPEGITHRQLIGYIAMIAGGNARINRSGYLEIMTYNFDDIEMIIDGGTFQPWTTGESVSGGTFNPWTVGEAISGGDFTKSETYHVLHQWVNAPIIDTDDIVITGVQTTYNDGENDVDLLAGEEGYVIKVDNPLIAGKEQTALALIGEIIVGGTFRQFEGDYIGYPIAEFMDPAVIVDRLGNAYATFITDINFVFLGITTIKNSSEPALRNNSQYYSGSTETLRKARSLVKKEQTARELAIQNLANALSAGSGLFMTKEKQSDGSDIYYMHNKKKLADSDIVWKLTSDAFGISTDGGKTYPYGITVTGEAILNRIYAEGISADYIDTGALVVKDSSGNIIFSVDMDTKAVVISGDSVKIGGKTATQAVSDAVTESKNYSDEKLADYAETVAASVSNLQAQIDGQIESHYYDYQPTLSNAPASSWTTESERAKHEGDLFFWKSKGYAYRFFKSGSTWQWQMVQDTDITKALAAAATAQDTADGKRRTFTTTPVPPYDSGDLWCQDGGDIMTCTIGRSSGNYVSSDWEKLNKYTDDTLAKQAIDLAEKSTSFYMILDNEYQGIPTDYNGNYTVFPTAKTSVTAFYGHTDVSSSCTYSVSKSSGVTGSWDASTRAYTVTALTADSGWVDITATYLNLFTVAKRFSIAKIKGGTPGPRGDQGIPGRSYFIEISSGMFKVLADDTVSPSSIIANAYYRDGEEFEKVAYAGRWGVQICDGNGAWGTTVNTSSDKSSYTLTAGTTLPTGAISAYRIYLMPAGGGDYIDYVTIPVVKDVFALSHEEVFSLLTNNGTVKGIYQEGDQLYISFTYAKGGALILGGNGNADGVLEVQDSAGNRLGGIDNTGISFETNDSSGVARSVKMRNAGVDFYKGSERTGVIRRMAWGNDYDNAEGIMFGTYANYLALARNSGSGWGAGYILNNGLNPSGYTERNLFYGDTRFVDSVIFPGKIESVEISLTDVAITSESLNGTFYGTALSLSDYSLADKEIVGILITNWTRASSSFTPYYQEGEIKIMSDTSMTIGKLSLKLTYI